MNQLEINKQKVSEFFDKIINKKDIDGALSYLGDHYIQHHPQVADGHEGLKQAIQLLRDKFPQARSEIKRIFAEGDHVILHAHLTKEPNSRGSALVDIFRLEQGKIVEHWYVGQEVPEHFPHANGML